MNVTSMEIFDVILVILYCSLLILVGLVIRGMKKSNMLYRDYFMKGLLVKLLGGVSFSLVYTYYYTYGGDSKSYWSDAYTLIQRFIENPVEGFFILFRGADALNENNQVLQGNLKFLFGSSEWFTVKISAVVGFFGMNNYFTTTILYAALSFYGVWHLFLALTNRYPKIHKQLAFSVLFIPSVFFWGSGMMKDSIVIGFLGILIYYTDKIIEKRGFKRVVASFIVLISAYAIFSVKAYVIISLIPAVIVWVIMSVRDKMESIVIKRVVLPFLVVISLFFISYALQFLGQYTERYSLEKVLDTAASVQNWHYVEGENTSEQHGRGSSYTLGEYDPTVWGTMKMFFPSVNATYFRPYLWEAKNVMMIFAAIESSIVFLYTLFIFLGLGFFRVLKIINNDAFLMMALSFALFFGFAVGFSSYNFGALVRYKIPCMPFYLSSLFILQFKVKELKEAKSWTTQSRRRASRQKARLSGNGL